MLGSQIQQLCSSAIDKQMFQYHNAGMILCGVGEVIILEHGAIFQLWKML